MGDDSAAGAMSAEEFRSLTDGLVRQASGGGTTVYKNAAGVGCPNPSVTSGCSRRCSSATTAGNGSARPATASNCVSVTPRTDGSCSSTTSEPPGVNAPPVAKPPRFKGARRQRNTMSDRPDDTTDGPGDGRTPPERDTPGRGIAPDADPIEASAPEAFGLVQAWWGDGKGKTTAVLGMGARAVATATAFTCYSS
jgi:cob(I)yrinic acid a,c-diamide adenosyltransferase (EC 2.5.1.17)